MDSWFQKPMQILQESTAEEGIASMFFQLALTQSFSNPFPNLLIWKHPRLSIMVVWTSMLKLALPLLVQQLRLSGKEATLTLIGEGDAVRGLQNIADNNGWFSVIETLKKKELASQLANHDIDCCPCQIPPFGDWQAH